MAISSVRHAPLRPLITVINLENQTASPPDRTIAGLAREGGVGVETVRFYQRRGLLPTPDRWSRDGGGAGIRYLAYRAAGDHPRGTEIAFRRASGEFYLSSALIERGLRQAMAERGRTVLQTTTVDPGAATGGFIFADQLSIPEGTVRAILVEVNFGGAPHQFTITLAPSGTSSEVPTNIPAVASQRMQAMQRTPETWHWTDGPPPTPYDGLEIIE